MEHKNKQMTLLMSEGYDKIVEVLKEAAAIEDITTFNPSQVLAEIINIVEHYDHQLDLLERI